MTTRPSYIRHVSSRVFRELPTYLEGIQRFASSPLPSLRFWIIEASLPRISTAPLSIGTHALMAFFGSSANLYLIIKRDTLPSSLRLLLGRRRPATRGENRVAAHRDASAYIASSSRSSREASAATNRASRTIISKQRSREHLWDTMRERCRYRPRKAGWSSGRFS